MRRLILDFNLGLFLRIRDLLETDEGRFAVMLGARIMHQTFEGADQAFYFAQHHRLGRLATIHEIKDVSLTPDEIWIALPVEDIVQKMGKQSRKHRNKVLITTVKPKAEVERLLLHPDARSFFAGEPQPA